MPVIAPIMDFLMRYQYKVKRWYIAEYSNPDLDRWQWEYQEVDHLSAAIEIASGDDDEDPIVLQVENCNGWENLLSLTKRQAIALLESFQHEF